MDTIDNETLAKELFSLMPLFLQTMFRAVRTDESGGVPPTQMQSLISLRLHQPQSMTQLARALRISKQQLTRVADALEQRGLIVRAPDEHNRRLVLLRLTEEGERCLDSVTEHRTKELAWNLEEMSAEEKHILMLASAILKKRFEGGLQPIP